ncbi:MAG: glycosyltransferase, partial [Thermoproteota archaeon]|nr:glycosyltransferase [Thermoproteota archaeon]
MRIAHIGNTAGIGSMLSREQQQRGEETNVFVFDDLTQSRFGGIKINYNSFIEKTLFYLRLKNYDVWHYHYPYGSLLAYLKKNFKKRIFLKHYHGSDLRMTQDKDFGFCLVSTPDLLKLAPNGKWLPIPVDLKKIDRFKTESTSVNDEHKLLQIAHYPYYLNKPEWDYFTHTFNYIEKENRATLVKVINLNHDQSLLTIGKSDLYIGKIIPEMGWFGTAETEAMALGKPVIAYVSDELYDLYKPPIFRTTKETFKKDLLDLIDDESERRRLSETGPQYVK